MPNGDNRETGCCVRLLGSLFIAGFVVLFYWAIFQPHHIRATVHFATLTNLTVTNTTSDDAVVSYHLSITFKLYNPSLRVNIYYDSLDAELCFRGTFLGRAKGTSPTEFYQRRKSDVEVKVDFDGAASASPATSLGELEKEKGHGAVSLEVAVDTRVRYKFSSTKIRQKPKIWCSLTIPVKAEDRGVGVGGALASGDRCSVKY